MEYNIGDIVVRVLNKKYYWDMVGIVKSKKTIGFKVYYNIFWSKPKLNIDMDRWQAHEFELVEDAKKV